MRIKLNDVKRVVISEDFIKLGALLKLAEITSSGGEAKSIIQNGMVYVSGEPCTMRGKKIKPGDIIRVDRRTILVVRE